MSTKTRPRQHADSMTGTTEDVDTVEGKNSENRRYSTFNIKQNQQQRDLSTTTNDGSPILNRPVPISTDERALHIAQLLQEVNLTDLIQLDTIKQIEYFLYERDQLMNEADNIRMHYEKQYQIVRHRLDEAENENERLIVEHRSLAKQLLLYKNFIEAPDNSNTLPSSKDYQQLQRTIEEIVRENERLYSELNYFKTSDPVYEQVQILETTNRHLQQQFNQAINENNHLRGIINFDEIDYLKSKLGTALEECEQLKLANIKLIQSKSSKQVHIYPSPPTSLSNQQPYSPISTRSSRSIDENLSTAADYSSPHDLVELHDHVHRLEQTLHQRDYDLQRLQNEIEKGTSSIMTSIEDLCTASSNISSPTNIYKSQSSSIEELQNQIDQLHDQLDELTHENQILQTRINEIDTIYEENEYLYAEKSQWMDEMEHARLRQLALEEEVDRLKQHEYPVNSSEIEWFNRTTKQLEDEIIHLREQIELITDTYEQEKRDLIEINEHYKEIFETAEDGQKLPKKLARIERINLEMENDFEEKKQEYERRIESLQEKNEKKYRSLHDVAIQLQDEYRQKELDFVQQMDEVVQQRDTIHAHYMSLQHRCEEFQQENQALKQELTSRNERNRDLQLALIPTHPETEPIDMQSSPLNPNRTNYEPDITECHSQIEALRIEHKQMIANYDAEILKTHQTIIQLQHDNNQYASQLERYQLSINKLRIEISEKQNFIEQIQNDLSERTALHVSINNQLSEENRIKQMKINELQQGLSHEQQHRLEFEQRMQDLLQSHSTDQESSTTTNDHLQSLVLHSNDASKREILLLRNELRSQSDQNILLQHTIEDEQLRRQRLGMKLKRMKQEYINTRTELYNRIEENQSLQYELIECRLKIDYYSHPTVRSLPSSNENESSINLQLYLKEKADHLHCQLRCRTYQQQVEHLQNTYELTKEKYKQRLQEEKEIFERTKVKYVDYIKNIQRDLQETRRLLEKDAEIKQNQESIYQQMIDERKQLLTNMVDKDTQEREIRHENSLLTSKIHLLEKQMENLHSRIDQTVHEQSQLRRDVNCVRWDINVSSDTSPSSSPALPSRRTTITYLDSPDRIESLGFKNDRTHEVSTTS